ncbi:MAG: DUF4399 domain-containing protein [Candidatus Thiodiazotropha sp.]
MAWSHSPLPETRVFFIRIQDGERFRSPFRIRFTIEDFGITPAGTTGRIRHPTSHHHRLFDLHNLPELDQPIPWDAQHRHFDAGETETWLELPSGPHTPQQQLGDETQNPRGPALKSDRITVIVE